jgi:hypothetical protein
MKPPSYTYHLQNIKFLYFSLFLWVSGSGPSSESGSEALLELRFSTTAFQSINPVAFLSSLPIADEIVQLLLAFSRLHPKGSGWIRIWNLFPKRFLIFYNKTQSHPFLFSALLQPFLWVPYVPGTIEKKKHL